MTSEKLYCFTCKRWITAVWWERHMASTRHRNRVLGIPPPPFTWKKVKTDDDDEPEAPYPGHHAVTERFCNPNVSNDPPANPPGPCMVYGCEHRRMGGSGHGRMHCPGHQQWARLEPFSGPTARADAREPTPSPEDDQNAPERPIARLLREREKARARNG